MRTTLTYVDGDYLFRLILAWLIL